MSSSQKKKQRLSCTNLKKKYSLILFIHLVSLCFLWVIPAALSDLSVDLHHVRLKTFCNSDVYFRRVWPPESATLPPYYFTNHGSCLVFVSLFFFLSPLPLYLLFLVFVCLCCAGFSQLCSPRRAFSEQGPLRLIKSASFFSGWRSNWPWLAFAGACLCVGCNCSSSAGVDTVQLHGF